MDRLYTAGRRKEEGGRRKEKEEKANLRLSPPSSALLPQPSSLSSMV
jgi:hypothetical protein